MFKDEYIICSAIHFQDGETYVHQPKNIKSGLVVAGMRHHNVFTTIKYITTNCGVEDSPLKGCRKVQGFLTSKNIFLDRKEGMKLARETGQTDSTKDELFSEDIY